MQKILLSNSKYLEEIIQGHESIIGIGIVELWKESSHSRRGRVGGDLVGHSENRCEKDLDPRLYLQSRSSLNVEFGYHQHRYLRKITVSSESSEIVVCQSPGELPGAERKRNKSMGRRLTHFDVPDGGRSGSICSANNMRRRRKVKKIVFFTNVLGLQYIYHSCTEPQVLVGSKCLVY